MNTTQNNAARAPFDGATPDFIPVIIGTDLNAYYMARCFNDEYHIRPLVLGKASMGYTSHSKILNLEIIGDLWDEQLFVSTLINTALKLQARYHKDECPPLLLVATNDFYVRLVVKNRDELARYYVFNYITPDVLDAVQIKTNFYGLCQEYGLDIPETALYDCSQNSSIPVFTHYPVIIKPANGDMYYRHPFEGQKKVYRLGSATEIAQVIKEIRASGYTDKLVIQEYIPGDDTYLYDCVVYVDSTHATRAVSYAQVLLQEHTPTAVGNLTSLVARYNEPYMKQLSSFAQRVGYVGFGNFDMKYDERDGRYKVLEINVRQGRSSYYMTTQGRNMAKLLVDDVILHRPPASEPVLLNEEVLFSVVPLSLVRRYVRSPQLRAEMRRLKREGRFSNPLINPKDRSLRRAFWKLLRSVNYYKKYFQNKW